MASLKANKTSFKKGQVANPKGRGKGGIKQVKAAI
jgi:hypothetical protein